ncbi:hypothetical protein ScPMuIL_017457 [Solemya velum]
MAFRNNNQGPRGMNWNFHQQQNYGPRLPGSPPFGSPPNMPNVPMYNQPRPMGHCNMTPPRQRFFHNGTHSAAHTQSNAPFGNGMRRFQGPGHMMNSCNQNEPTLPAYSPQNMARSSHCNNHFYKNVNTFHENRNYSEKQHNFHQNGTTKKKKKVKVDKRELPENNQFSCDTCDRGFKTKEKYEEHVSQHEQCHIENCRYTAAPKLVRLHIMLQHKSGLAKKIWQNESEEDVNSWIAQRRKNFPTKETVKRKEALNAERKACGEVLENKTFGKMRNRNNFRQHRNQQGKRFNDSTDLPCHGVTSNKKPKIEDTGPSKEVEDKGSDVCGDQTVLANGQEVDPLSLLLNNTQPDSQSSPDTLAAEKLAEQVKSGEGLDALHTNYGDSGNDSPDEQDLKPKPARTDMTENDSKKDDLNSTKKTKRKSRKRNNANSMGKNQQQGMYYNKKSSLLEKLLAPDIRHERNVILQCAYYIVKKKFFGIDSASVSIDGQNMMQDHCEGDNEVSTEMLVRESQ